MITKLLVFAIVVFLAGLALRTFMPQFGDSVAGGFSQRDGETRLADCPGAPNCASSEASNRDRQADRIAISGNVSATMQKLVGLVTAQPGFALTTQDDRYVHFTYTSAVMQYVDDVEMLISDDQQSVQIRSASRLGKSDLGANAKRVEELRSVLNGQL